MKGRAREINTQNGASAMVNPMRGAASRSGALATRLMSSNRLEEANGRCARGDDTEQHYEACREQLESSLPITLKCLSAVSDIAEPILVALLQEAAIRKFKAKDRVLEPDEPDDRIHLVVDGVITLHTYTENGRQIINDYLGRGFLFGETALTEPEGADFRACSKGASTVASISRERFIEVGMANPSLLRVLTAQLIRRLRSADYKARDLAFLDVSGRVANVLQQLAKGPCAITHPDGMQIRMTRQEIGLIVGCSREMVGRAIKALAQEGAIEVSGKNIVVRGTR